MSTAPALAPKDAAATARPRSRRAWTLPLVALALIAVAVAFVVGIRGLLANPVQSANADGSTTLQGTFEPYLCNAAACNGYVQAGARSVFVQFPANCPPPVRGSEITLRAQRAPDLGKGAYRATACV
jgi:hypothetical protein